MKPQDVQKATSHTIAYKQINKLKIQLKINRKQLVTQIRHKSQKNQQKIPNSYRGNEEPQHSRSKDQIKINFFSCELCVYVFGMNKETAFLQL